MLLAIERTVDQCVVKLCPDVISYCDRSRVRSYPKKYTTNYADGQSLYWYNFEHDGLM